VKSKPGTARSYFAIGIEGGSNAVNLGNLLRSAHAFGASFMFTIGPDRALGRRRRGGLTPSPGQGKIKYVCFHPLTRIGTEKCAEPFELPRSSQL
jgi:hypothetical protein